MSAHIPLSSVGTTNYERIMGHAPHVLKPWAELEQTFFYRSILPAELVELIAFISFMWAGGTFGKVLGINRPRLSCADG